MASDVLSKDHFAKVSGLGRKTFYFFRFCDAYVKRENKRVLKVLEIIMKKQKSFRLL